ncbi:hypothetical protein MUO14_07165 [Halobacillus shinanisalinarum]|uniref:Uncharacterized protein n=1 Tax=Halobacillus shinanisalinarum TaxID=2932258 RepID=A0ABY4H3E1_9BACI|nr:hypothetical protein [Halobacillus shinanisalinarum]UOQ94716.1 hypothetical protein MUO14_07165 [Halobacillus shinanisalinarum]
MDKIEQSLVEDFQRKLDRDLTKDERELIKWMTVKHYCEYDNAKEEAKSSKVG